jgi:LuxR family transcriptional regulator, maltose regulon positive regulatory protein
VGLLTRPRTGARLVSRTRQLKRLNRLAPLTLIEALPGFGKSTLAATWAEELVAADTRLVWVNAAPEIDDHASFLEILHQGLQRAEVLPRTAPRAPQRDSALPGLVDELRPLEQTVMVVIDDAHRLRDPEVADTVARLVKLVHPVRVTVTTEPGHHFHDAAARRGLETNVLRGADLSITADDVTVYAEAWGHELSTASARKLHGLVGGWPLPLREVLDATPSWSDGFDTQPAHDFLQKQVLPAKVDPAAVSTEMLLAVPERFDVELAHHLVGGDDAGTPGELVGEQAIAALEQEGLLWRLPREDGTTEWRYPPLLRRVLLEQLERIDPDALRAAHRSVAAALAKRGGSRSGAMLHHARAAGDWSLLAELWAGQGWSLAGGDAADFASAFADLPDAVLAEHPTLTLAASIADAFAATPESSGWMHRLEASLRAYMEAGVAALRSEKQPREGIQRAELLTAAMLAVRSRGDLPGAQQLAGEAAGEIRRARLEDPGSVRSSQVAWFDVQNAITQLLGANYRSVQEHAVAAHQLAPDTLIGAGASGLLSMLHAVGGFTNDARSWLAAHEAVDLSGQWASGLAELPARLTRAMLALDRLDEEAAEAELAHAVLGPESSGLWPLILIAHHRHALLFGDPVAMLSRLEHVRRALARHIRDGYMASQVMERCTLDLLLAMGEVDRVQARLPESQETKPWLLAPVARFHLITGDPKQAARVSGAGIWRNDISGRDRVEMLVTSSLALREQGETGMSLEAFRRAHALTVESGSLQPLLLMSAEVRRELLDATGLALAPEVVARLDATRPIYPEHAELVQLTPREREVLRQMRHHTTAVELARTLSVSVNTVRKQMVSLYAKLDVHDRASALLRAQALGLIDDRS